MKLITLACPNCGAKLEVNENLKQANCNYCGYGFLVDNEEKYVSVEIENPQQLGRDIEIGRRSVRGGNTDLAREVHALIKPLSQIETVQEKINRLNGYIQKHESYKVTLIVVTACIGGFFLFGCFTVGIDILAMGIVFTMIPGFLLIYHMARLKDLRAQLNRAKEDLDSAQKTLQMFNINIIPPAYRNKQAVLFFYDALINQRAMTMQEAVNLYEQELRYNRMETLQRISAQAALLSAELANASLKYRL